MAVTWEIKIRHDGMWPFRWTWTVWRREGFDSVCRSGDARSKERAHHKAARAKLSMERDDVLIEEPADASASASDYVCPQCGPAPEGPDEHAERFHTWLPSG